MTLAGGISSTTMKIIAVKNLGFKINEVKTLESATREDQWMMKFELLNQWKNKNPRNNRQVIDAYLNFKTLVLCKRTKLLIGKN